MFPSFQETVLVLSRRPSAFIFYFQPQIAVIGGSIDSSVLREVFGRFEESTSSTAVIIHSKLYKFNLKLSEKQSKIHLKSA